MCGEVWIYEQTTKTMRSKEIGLCALDLVNVEDRYSTHLGGGREGEGRRSMIISQEKKSSN